MEVCATSVSNFDEHIDRACVSVLEISSASVTEATSSLSTMGFGDFPCERFDIFEMRNEAVTQTDKASLSTEISLAAVTCLLR